jgi:hypothetical protein
VASAVAVLAVTAFYAYADRTLLWQACAGDITDISRGVTVRVPCTAGLLLTPWLRLRFALYSHSILYSPRLFALFLFSCSRVWVCRVLASAVPLPHCQCSACGAAGRGWTQ